MGWKGLIIGGPIGWLIEEALSGSSSSSSSSDEERRRLERQAKEERAQKERDFILSCVKTELTGLCEEHVSGANSIQVSSFDKLREAFKTNPQNNPILRQLQQQMNESQDAIKGRLEILRLEQELNALRLAKQALSELDLESF
ncbi:hypothetical protein [Chromatium okenii]|uniref:Uncharacterized protein n=1 Tax=Chromatium okenii TaxID=61644 RepID=A0A2S7XRF8_9GAMM|nr:hypothetical protein [Chromatium okenii]MBV5311061.1 hypothetical protein [Chromatium okenii]PQJ96334.1 hypothetical protein CXB77_11400 [Chromatium okenii]